MCIVSVGTISEVSGDDSVMILLRFPGRVLARGSRGLRSGSGCGTAGGITSSPARLFASGGVPLGGDLVIGSAVTGLGWAEAVRLGNMLVVSRFLRLGFLIIPEANPFLGGRPPRFRVKPPRVFFGLGEKGEFSFSKFKSRFSARTRPSDERAFGAMGLGGARGEFACSKFGSSSIARGLN